MSDFPVFSFEEMPDSRDFSLSQSSETWRYKAAGEQDDGLVKAYAFAYTYPLIASIVGILRRQDIRVTPAGYGQYVVEVIYGKIDRQVGSFTFDFDTTGATIKVFVSKEHVNSYPSTSDNNPHKGALNVDKDGKVQGADIVIPALKLTYRYRHPQGVITEDFAKNLSRATGYVNSDAWRSFDPGELLFIGATGSDGSDSEAEVAYQFVASQNTTDLQVGDITDIVKDGHHYAWVEFDDDVDDDGRAASPPRRVHIERVYDPISFADYFGWS